MKKSLVILAAVIVSLLLPASVAIAADCEIKACIEVYTQDGHLVIEGRKGSGPKASKVPEPRVTATHAPRPRVSPQVKRPRPTTTSSAHRSKPPTVKRPKKRAVAASQSATSLQDKLIESIPTAGIAYQPSFSPLIQTPVYFWSDVPTLVTKKIEIVGEFVDLRLRPTFLWHYGDGVIYATREVGAAFPEGKIRHSYSKPGHYLIELITRWDGEFTVDGVTAHIPGDITTVSVLPITVVAAPTRFLN